MSLPSLQSPLDTLLSMAKGIVSTGKSAISSLLNTDVGKITGNTQNNATTPGIVANTILGLPKATLDVGKDIAQGIARTAIGFGGDVRNAVVPDNQRTFEVKPEGILKTLVGDEPIKTLASRVASSEQSIKASPFAQKYGLDKGALPLAFAGTIGGSALDLTPFGGGEKGAISAIAKSTDKTFIARALRTIGIAEDLIPSYAEKLATVTDEKAVASALQNAKKLQSTTRVATGNLASDAIGAAERKATGLPVLQNTPKPAIDSALNLPKIEEGVTKYVGANKDALANQYTQTYGNVYNVDNYKELIPGHAENRTISEAFHRPAAEEVGQMINKQLEATRGSGKDVVFVGGATGAGKSTAIENLKGIDYKITGADAVIDGTLADVNRTSDTIRKALETGHEIEVMYVETDPTQLLDNLIERAQGGGRTVPIETAYNTLLSSRQNLLRLNGKFGENPKFRIEVVHNTPGVAGQNYMVENPLDYIKSRSYTKDDISRFKDEAYKRLDAEYKQGTISQKIYEGFTRRKATNKGEITQSGHSVGEEFDLSRTAKGKAETGQAGTGQPLSEIDQAIADGKIRVSREGTRDIYEYKKGNTWQRARDESSALKGIAPKPSQALQLPQILQEKKLAIEIQSEALSNSPLNSLTKYVAKRGEFKGQLPEVLGKGKSTWGRKGDDILTEHLGNIDSETARAQMDKFLADKKALVEQKQIVSAEEKAYREGLKTSSTKVPPVVKTSVSGPLPLYTGSTGEVRSVEKAAQESLARETANSGVELPSLTNIVKQATPLSKRVGILDYIRTPENVLKKMGLDAEAKLIRKQYEGYVAELPKNIDKITAWSKEVPKDSNVKIFRYLDNENVDLTEKELKVALEIKDWLRQWADRLGLPQDNRIAEYITHIFDDQLIKKEFDEDLAKIITDKIPSSVYDPFLQKRLGAKGYKQDVWAALDAYVKRATRKVYMDPALARLEEAGASMEKSQWDYLKSYTDKINMRPSDFDTGVDNSLKQIIGYKLGQRPVANISRTMRQMTFRGMLGLNVGSAARNLSQGVNTFAKLGTRYTATGYVSLFKKGSFDELKNVGVLANNFVQDRALSATKKSIEKLDKGLFFMFDLAEKINRGSAYFGAKAKALAGNMSEADAIDYAKKIVRDTQFNYGSIDTPVAMNSDIAKIFTQFLTYPVKQTEFLLGMAKNKEYMGIARYTLGGLAFVYTVGKAMGMDPTELVPWYNYVSGQSTFGVPPSMKLPVEITKAAFNAPNAYGQPRSLGTKLSDIGTAGVGMIPGGLQIKKTVQGIQANMQGGSFDKAGRKQFSTGTSPASSVQNILFGKYASSGAQDYFNKTKVTKTLEEIKKGIADDLSSGKIDVPVAKARYLGEVKQLKTEEKKVRLELPVNEYKSALAKQIEAKTLTVAEAKREYVDYAKNIKDQEKQALDTKTEFPEKNIMQLVSVYAKALGTDPANAFKAMLTREKINKVEGNLVELQRFYGINYQAKGGSEEYMKKELQNMGISWSKRANYNLEHIVPVSAGGSNDPSNLQIISRDLHNTYTDWDIVAGRAVSEGKMTRGQVSKIAEDLKVNKTITLEEALQKVK